MENDKLNKGSQIYLYEIIERIVRFDIHLDEIQEQFYCDNKNKRALIGEYKYYLSLLFKEIVSKRDKQNLIETLKTINELINELHREYLSILPRPSEPVELTRFERVIKKQILKLKNNNKLDVSISINESTGENTDNDYLSAFRDIFNKKLEVSVDNHISIHKDDDANLISITIPRIEAPNTFRWPSLIHEMCHHLIGNVNKGLNSGNIKSDFLNFWGNNKTEEDLFDSFFAKPICVNDNDSYKPQLEDWLIECFCDLFACLLIGPSFYFSQFVVFLNNSDQTRIEKHPPHLLRLELIESLISHRFNDLYDSLLSNSIGECHDLLEQVQLNNYGDDRFIHSINNIFNTFNQYFLSFFLNNASIKGNPDINQSLKEIVDRYVNIQADVIKSLSERLKQGLPIPSIRSIDEQGNYVELPTYVQEILLSSWLVKLDFGNDTGNAGLIENIINKKLIGVKCNYTQEDIDALYSDIKKTITRHDQAVLKSIQVSEWFDMLTNERERVGKIKLYHITENKSRLINKSKNVLVDKEIKELICHDELKIIPLMYTGQTIGAKERSQIGTTSIDVRLGTSFQVFSPNQSGIIDFTIQNDNTKESSKRIDLDFMESITIAPRQFMLGHSMEYVKLPNNICGNLEGRSSFARLGLEIHMTAGFIDPGFEGVITLEIYNAGPTTIKLYPGMRIGQLRLEKNTIPQNTYDKKDVKYKGLLEHNLSLQSKDVEVEMIKQCLNN